MNWQVIRFLKPDLRKLLLLFFMAFLLWVHILYSYAFYIPSFISIIYKVLAPFITIVVLISLPIIYLIVYPIADILQNHTSLFTLLMAYSPCYVYYYIIASFILHIGSKLRKMLRNKGKSIRIQPLL